MENGKKKRVLVCPMDWGLGHATRCVPIIELFRKHGAEVIIGADKKPLAFLKSRFPDLQTITIEGFQPRYQKKGSLLMKVAADIPKMMKIIKPVQQNFEKIIMENGIDMAVSDNRYELWSEQIPTVFMTHQLNIMTGGILKPARAVVQRLIYGFIEKHQELWIPDNDSEPVLAGKLSHPEKYPSISRHYIGILSRFEGLQDIPAFNEEIDVLCLLSGPEPQRTLFEEKLTAQLKAAPFKTIMLQGIPPAGKTERVGNVLKLSHAEDREFASMFKASHLIISRSGYSTLMDLALFGKKALLVPTPGQPEQEYLARTLAGKNVCNIVSQKKMNLERDIPIALSGKGFTMKNDYSVLKRRIKELME